MHKYSILKNVTEIMKSRKILNFKIIFYRRLLIQKQYSVTTSGRSWQERLDRGANLGPFHHLADFPPQPGTRYITGTVYVEAGAA
jgi:hypothetical protein